MRWGEALLAMLRPALIMGPLLGGLGGALIVIFGMLYDGEPLAAFAIGAVFFLALFGVILGLLVATPLCFAFGAILLRMSASDEGWLKRKRWLATGGLAGGAFGFVIGALIESFEAAALLTLLFGFLGLLGGALLVRGLRRRSLRGIATAAVGGWLVSRAAGWDARVGETVRSEAPIDRWREDLSEASGPTEVSRTVTVGKSPEELYEIWRDPERLSRVVGHFAEVTSVAEDRLRWTVEGPLDREVGWETHVVKDEPGELIRWETPSDAMLPNQGSIRFEPAPGDRGTKVTLSMRFDPPGGALGEAALRQLDVVPETIAGEALRRFKSLAETGDIQTTEGNVSARGRGDRL